MVPSTIPTLPGVTAYFWVTARATQVIPQLFSAVLGNPMGISSARASAAIVPMPINGALHTLNRQFDSIASSGLGEGVDIGGSGQITVTSGVVMSSQAANAGSGVTVTAPVTIVSPGNASGLGASPITQVGDSGQFLDPYRDVPPPRHSEQCRFSGRSANLWRSWRKSNEWRIPCQFDTYDRASGPSALSVQELCGHKLRGLYHRFFCDSSGDSDHTAR